MTWTILMAVAGIGFIGFCVWDTYRFERRLNSRA